MLRGVPCKSLKYTKRLMGILIFADYPLYDLSSGSVPQIYYHRCTKDARDFFAMSM